MSSVSVRIFFITDEDEILKVPFAKFERMLKGAYKEKTKSLRESVYALQKLQ